jgi:ABC-type dipeptide/oligopeptide/nickel transport system ATPase component/ABC-type dipeptide/oligopeptide/nickel transport system permease subunit
MTSLNPMAQTVDDQAVELVDATPPARGRISRRLLRQPFTVASVIVLVILVLVAIFADVIAPYGVNEQSVSDRLQGVSAEHWLGTDYLGRDVLTRLIYGARNALVIAVVPVGCAAILGTSLGMLAGYRRGWWDRIFLRLADISDILPSLVLALVIMAILGPNQLSVGIALMTVFITSYLRLSRALVLSEGQKLYVEAAHIGGLRESNILFRQILPNISGPLIVQTAIFMGTAILIEASLSFLGLDPSRATWGGMLSNAMQYQLDQPLLPWPPGIAITIAVLCFNLIGDGIRDALSGERRRSRAALRKARLSDPLASQYATTTIPTGKRKLAKLRSASAAPAPRSEQAATSGLLAVTDLTVSVPDGASAYKDLVTSVSLSVAAGEVVGVVGESGSGKSMTALAALGLLPEPVFVRGGGIRVTGTEITDLDDGSMRKLRGSSIGIVFQDPLTSLSPVHTIGRQLCQAVRNHHPMSKRAASERALELLTRVGIPDPRSRLGQYPHQLSGGMVQRVGIAMALAGEPRLLIADEATTALDMRVQKQIMDLIRDLQRDLGMGVLIITHDLGLAADVCDRIVVMRHGRIVEEGPSRDVFAHPQDAYTRELLDASPSHERPAAQREIDARHGQEALR